MAMTYTCKRCGQTYESERGEADTNEAYKAQKWKEGDAAPANQAVLLCEPCYIAFSDWYANADNQ